MVSKIKYFLLLVISTGFLQAALEVNYGAFENTFEDQYDTYLQSDSNPLQLDFSDNSSILDLFLRPNFGFVQSLEFELEKRRSNKDIVSFRYQHRPIYLKNCSFLI